MPRNGDGSSDNGPIEGKEILHGAKGDDTLQHTKHVAPMPDVEAGDALPGMSAGGAAAPIASDAEQYGVNEPHHDSTSASTSNDSTTGQKRSEPHHASPSRDRSHLDQKFSKLDKDEVDMAAAGSETQERSARAQRRQDAVGESKGKGDAEVKRFGGHADVEELHGAATLEHAKGAESAAKVGGKKEESAGGEKKKNKDEKEEEEESSGAKDHGGKKNAKGEANEAEMIQRRNAEKLGVHLGDDE
ncbi:hypothetical protein TW65_08178 [Stemphylium lycopersici]|uniref:Wd repeat-containing protein n=1 Tax=Stemphylium lycopersici TaxID=183478 RepID=A0A364NGK5_STELY|nr:hypothetical protein TW65_08178 [Stemphylium lycopersici]RAR16428.1 wd repeat-containing protein [Stemphylium lycopersici]